MTRAFVTIIAFSWALVAGAEESHVISRARITLADVVAVPVEMAAVDLGPAPPPGGSRLFGRGEIADKVRAAGFDPAKLRLPPGVRVVSASQRLSPAALAKLATPAVERSLPQGVTLTKIEPSHDIVTAPGAAVRAAAIPRLPRQKGLAQSTAVLELATHGNGAADAVKIPVAITVEIGEAAAHADVPRGARLEVTLERGAVRIATSGVALGDAEIGDTTMVSLDATSRSVRVRILSKDRAQIVEPR